MATTAKSAVSTQSTNVQGNAVLTLSKVDESKPSPEKEKQASLLLPSENPVNNEKKEITISSIMEKAEKLHLLKKKYEELNEKRKSLDLFEISHDRDNSQMQLVDIKGLTFESSNPKCIKKVIEIWKEEFTTAIEEAEKQMRSLISA